MKFTVNNTTYKVSWKYEPDCEIPELPNARGCVTAIIDNLSTAEADNVVAINFAFCSKNDKFVKKVGRKISFERAVEDAFPEDKDARTIAWEAFLKECKI